MLDNLSSDSKVLVFRLCVSIFVSSLQFICCLVAKLLKEHSLFSYNLMSSFGLGVIFAECLSLTVSGRRNLTNQDAFWSDLAFLAPFLLVVCFNHTNISSSKAYQRVSGVEDGSLEEQGSSLEIEQQDDEDSAIATLTPVQELYPTWRMILLLAFFLREVAAGMAIGLSQHSSIVGEFSHATSLCCCLSLVFGLVCEESIAIPRVFLMNLLALASAMPLGLVLGAVYALQTGINNNNNTSSSSTSMRPPPGTTRDKMHPPPLPVSSAEEVSRLVCLLCVSLSVGLTVAAAFAFLLPLDRAIDEQYQLKEQEGKTMKHSYLKGGCLAMGYLLNTLQAFLL